jgi:hypothetical protein
MEEAQTTNTTNGPSNSSTCDRLSDPVIVIHGGAWAIPESLAAASVEGVKRAAREGHRMLREGGSAVDAVEAAVSLMEDDPVFDAGKFNSNGFIIQRKKKLNGNLSFDGTNISNHDCGF